MIGASGKCSGVVDEDMMKVLRYEQLSIGVTALGI